MDKHPNDSVGLVVKTLLALWIIAVVAVFYWKHPLLLTESVDLFNQAVQEESRGNYHEAVRLLDQAIEMEPRNTGFFVRKGAVLVQAGLSVEAGRAFATAAALDPGNVEAVFGLAATLQQTGHPREAIDRLLSLPPNQLSTEVRFRRARALAASGAFEAARRDLDTLLKSATDSVEVLHEAALVARAQQDHRAAVDFYRRMIPRVKHEDDRAEMKYGLATALLESGQTEEASRLAAEIVEEFPTSKEFLLLAARAASQAANPALTVSYLERLAELRPLRPPEQLWLAGQTRAVGNVDKALELYQAALSQPDVRSDSAAVEALADLQYDKKQFPEALRGYLMIPEDKVSADQYLKIARAAREGNESAIAAEALHKYLQARPDDWTSLFDLVTVQKQLGNLAAARSTLERILAATEQALSRNPDSVDERLFAARAASELGIPRKVVQHLEAMESKRPLTRSEVFWLAGQYRQAGDIKKALARYESLMADPSFQDRDGVLSAVADLQFDLGNFASALNAYQSMTPEGRPADFDIKIARAARGAGQKGIAMGAYRKHVALHPDDIEAALDLADLIRDSGDRAEADKVYAGILKTAETRMEVAGKTPAVLLSAARAASELGDSKTTVKHLDHLATLRPLAAPERGWLAGQLRLSGEPARSLAVYEELFREQAGNLDPSALEALGDLRGDARNPKGAMEAYFAVPAEKRKPVLNLKIARQASLSSDLETAIAFYRDYVAKFPNDVETCLEAARFFINVGEIQTSLGLYEQIVASRGAAGLGVELARANLAANRFPEAEKWARAALKENKTDWRAQLALAQALHLQGHFGDAKDILDDYRDELKKHPEGLEWLGLMAIAMDRHLEAFNLFSTLVNDKQTARIKYWLWRGRAAQGMGDFVRASESFDQAQAMLKAAGSTSLEAATRDADEEVRKVKEAGKSR